MWSLAIRHPLRAESLHVICPLHSTNSRGVSVTPFARYVPSRGAATSRRDVEVELLGPDPAQQNHTDSARFAPILTADALSGLDPQTVPQKALYGRIISQNASRFPVQPVSPKLYVNTNTPFSGLICGVQGSGKSHSTAVLLESCLIPDERLGTLPAPVSALVFHYDTAAGGGLVQPCEAAYLAIKDRERGSGVAPPVVTVLVMPQNLEAMKRVYAGLPGVNVQPLHFSQEDISGQRLLSMMKVDDDTQIPLYMESVMSLLRSMETNFAYEIFKAKMRSLPFNPSQKAMLNLRLSLLDSCLCGGNMKNRIPNYFRPGHLTIVDLSSPFMDARSACGFFDFILGLFVEGDPGAAAKLIVLDEAHKYLSDSTSGGSSRLTDSLLTVIRQQRHLGTRVVVSTQEPTVVPTKYVDLCSIVIAHRFSSPKWLHHLSNHVPAAETRFDELLSKIVTLPTGQAIIFAPNGLGLRNAIDPPAPAGRRSGNKPQKRQTTQKKAVLKPGVVAPFGQGYIHVQSRLRVTSDGGRSILAMQDATTDMLPRRILSRPSSPSPPSVPESSGEALATAGRSSAEATASPAPPVANPSVEAPAKKVKAAKTKETTPSNGTKTNSTPPKAKTTTQDKAVEVPSKAVFERISKYLEVKRAGGAQKISLKNIRKNLASESLFQSINVEEAVRQAANSGIVRMVKEKEMEWVTLVQLQNGSAKSGKVKRAA